MDDKDVSSTKKAGKRFRKLEAEECKHHEIFVLDESSRGEEDNEDFDIVITKTRCGHHFEFRSSCAGCPSEVNKETEVFDDGIFKSVGTLLGAFAVICLILFPFLPSDFKDGICGCEDMLRFVCYDGNTTVLDPKHCPTTTIPISTTISSTSTSTVKSTTSIQPVTSLTTTSLATSVCTSLPKGEYCEEEILIKCDNGIKTILDDCSTVRKPIWDYSGPKPKWYWENVAGECREHDQGADCYEKDI